MIRYESEGEIGLPHNIENCESLIYCLYAFYLGSVWYYIEILNLSHFNSNLLYLRGMLVRFFVHFIFS